MKDFFTVSELSKIEKVNPMTIIRWIRKGLFPNARRVGKSFRVPLEDYLKWRDTTKLNTSPIVPSNNRTFERTQ